MPAGFYWHTVETDEKYFAGSSDIRESGDTDTEVKHTHSANPTLALEGAGSFDEFQNGG